MAAPLTQSIFQPTDFDAFLDEIGFTDLSPQSRAEMVANIASAVEYAVVRKIYRLLSNEDQIRLLEIMQEADETGNEEPVNSFLLERIPDADILAEEAVEEVKNDLRRSSVGMRMAVEQHVNMIDQMRQAEQNAAELDPLSPDYQMPSERYKSPLAASLEKDVAAVKKSEQTANIPVPPAPPAPVVPEVDSSTPFPWELPTPPATPAQPVTDEMPVSSDSTDHSSNSTGNDSLDAINSELETLRKSLDNDTV